VSVVNPRVQDYRESSKSLEAATKREKDKIAKYLNNHEIPERDIIPLIFETYGGYSEKTFESLKRLCKGASRGDDQIAAMLLQQIRWKIAIILKKCQVDLIIIQNRKNEQAGIKFNI
jgi:hypothetical protein